MTAFSSGTTRKLRLSVPRLVVSETRSHFSSTYQTKTWKCFVVNCIASKPRSNMALNLAPFGRRTLRDKAVQRRLALRWADMTRPRRQR
jgi:hypothetical protein